MNNDKTIDAKTEKEIYEEARDRLALAVEAENKNRLLAKEDLLFREGEQWPPENPGATSASMETPELTINLTDAKVTRVVNNMKQQRPRIKCHPVGDGADIDTSNTINGLIRHIEYRSEASVAYDKGGEMAVTMGWGFWRVYSEYASYDSFDQELKIATISNPFTVYVDPSALMPTACDAMWGIITSKMKKIEYKRKYPNQEIIAWTDQGNEEDRDWQSSEDIRIAEYFRLTDKTDTLYLLETPDGRQESKFADELPSKQSMKATGWKIVDERKTGRRQLEWFLLNGKKVIDRQELPGTYIPIIRCEGNAVDIDGEIYRRGMVRAMKDPQRMVNYGEVAKIKRLGLTPQAPWVAAEGQLDGHPEWDASNLEPHATLTYKPVTVQTDQGDQVLPPPMRQAPAGVEQGFSEFVGVMRSNLNEVSGMPNEPGQDMGGQVVSGVAIKKREGMSDQSHFQYYDKQTQAIRHTGVILLELIPHYYSEQRMQRIIGDDGVPAMVQINQPTQENGVSKIKNDLTIGRYDVQMDTGPGYETKRQEGAEGMLELLGTPIGEEIAKTAPDLIIRAFDFPYAQELADRFAAKTPEGLEKVMGDLPPRAQQIIKSLMQANQAMQQKIQADEQGLTKAQLEAQVKAHDVQESNLTKRHDTQVKADTAIHVQHMKGDNALHVEMVKSGTALIDSRNVGEHEKVMEGMKQLHEGEMSERDRNPQD